MRSVGSAFIFLILLSMNIFSQGPKELAEIWDKDHITTIDPSNVRHVDLLKYLDELKRLGIKVEQVGSSNANRAIYQAEFGTGPLKVFMWSQMHGDEPTATSALMDMFAFFASNRDLPWVKKISETMTIRIVPMLNPDGTEAFQRRNLQGIDINRDAIDLATPEARVLKRLRDDWSPSIGFNLHNQRSLTSIGNTNKQAAISLLVVYGDAAKTTDEGFERNKRVAAAMVDAIEKLIPGHVGRYGDEYTPTAFGDRFSGWGTPVILVETGSLYGKSEMFLVKVNFVAFITALNSLATGSEKTQNPQPYLSLIENGSGAIYNFIFRRANIIRSPSSPSGFQADIGVNTERRRANQWSPNFIREVGDLTKASGLEEFDASAFNVIQRFGRTIVGELGELFFYRKERTVDFRSDDLERQFPPDAIFSGGRWISGKGVVPLIVR
jgi:hypothetical protein